MSPVPRALLLLALLIVCLGLGAQEPVTPPRAMPPSAKKGHDPAKLTVPQRNTYLSAQRGMEWLHKANKPDGRFVYGFLPALRLPMEGDDFVHQAGAAFALGRCARFFDDERAGAIARQAVLTLLLETTLDPKDKNVRYSAAPPHLVNRAAATAFLTLAVHDLPAPGPDLLEQADQMANYLRSLVNADGSVRVVEGESKIDAEQPYAGAVLYALARSHAARPAPWKVDLLRKACPACLTAWTKARSLPMVPWHTAACVEAYAQTKEKAFADCVFALNDWLCEQQYTRADPGRGHWLGGFMPWRDWDVLEGTTGRQPSDADLRKLFPMLGQ